MRSIVIPPDIKQHNQTIEVLKDKLAAIRNNIIRMSAVNPDVSIIIPAHNEEDHILKTLSSLSASCTTKGVEIIVVNNNSGDKTGELAVAAGATCILETKPGVTAARNTGLQLARGKYILNADADTIYPSEWIDLMLLPLEDDTIAMVYGNFSFIPSPGKSRMIYIGYEYLSGFFKWLNKKFRDQAVNIYGFNSAFRRTEGIAVGGFDHPAGTNEDGWLGIKLRNTFQKKLYKVTEQRAFAWTSDRRIEMDGGLYKAILKRFRRHLIE
ncbi:MAG: glycosyltransferase family 2 protein [Chitinophagaceae bacterium]